MRSPSAMVKNTAGEIISPWLLIAENTLDEKYRSMANRLSPAAPTGTRPGSTFPLDSRVQQSDPIATPTINAANRIEISLGSPANTVTAKLGT